MSADPTADPLSVVHSGCVKLSGEAVRVGAPQAPPKAQPRIELVRADDGTVRAIDITCGCGEKIRVLCEYD